MPAPLGASPQIRNPKFTAWKLLEAVVDRTPAKSPQLTLLIELGGGVRMELADGGQLTLVAQLIQALQQSNGHAELQGESQNTNVAPEVRSEKSTPT